MSMGTAAMVDCGRSPRDAQRRRRSKLAPGTIAADPALRAARTGALIAGFLVARRLRRRARRRHPAAAPAGSSTTASPRATARRGRARARRRRARGRRRRRSAWSSAGSPRGSARASIYDLRTAGLRPRPAPAGRLLHPGPDRRAGLPAQQRRHRRPAGLHLDAVRRRVQRRPLVLVAGAMLVLSWQITVVLAAAAAAVPAARPRCMGARMAAHHPRADAAQRRDGRPR